MLANLVTGAKHTLEIFRHHPGTIAIIGFTGVLLFSLLNWQPLLYISLAIAILAYLIYTGQRKGKVKK